MSWLSWFSNLKGDVSRDDKLLKKVNYPYKDRKMQYRTERMELEKAEIDKINQFILNSMANENEKEPDFESFLSMNSTKQLSFSKPKKVIFDTDLGTDIDDALALLILLHMPEEAEILGVTTTYGHTRLRARLCEKIIEARSWRKQQQPPPHIPVFAGEPTPLGTHRDVWHTGTEGLTRNYVGEQEMLLLTKKEVEELSANDVDETVAKHKAAHFIIDTIKKYPNEVTLICLGALTNVATGSLINLLTFPWV